MSDTEHFHAVAGERITITEPCNLHSPTRAGADEATLGIVRAEAATLAGLPLEMVTAASPLLALGFDSLDLLQLAMNLEDRCGIDIPDEACDQPELGTVRGLAALIDSLPSMQTVAAEPMQDNQIATDMDGSDPRPPWKVPIVRHCGGIYGGVAGSVVSENGEDQPASGQNMAVSVSVPRSRG